MNKTFEIGDLLKTKRQMLGLSLRELSQEIGLSYSAIARIERKVGNADVESLAILADWLEIPLARFINAEKGAAIYLKNEPLPNIIAKHLSQDQNLSPENQEFLTTFFRQTYDQFIEFEKRKLNFQTTT